MSEKVVVTRALDFRRGGARNNQAGPVELWEVQNKSGGSVVRGDVVVWDKTSNSTADKLAFTTTTSGNNVDVMGMVYDTSIASNAFGRVQVFGPTDALKVDGTTDIAIGDYLSTFTTVKIAQKTTGTGAFARAMEAYATNDSSGVIDAFINVRGFSVASAATAAHTHAGAGTGGQLDWDDIWSDAVHSHASDAEGGGTISPTAVTASGNIGTSDGDLNTDEGKLTVDTTTDETSYIKRNQGTTTGPVMEIEETATAADNACLLIDHNATGAVDAVTVQNDGTGYGISLEPQAAGAGGLVVLPSTGGLTSRMIYVNGTPGDGWVGTGSVGMVELASDGALVADGSLLRVISTGQPAAANDGICAELLDTGAAQATSYVVRIASTNNEALHVDAGVSLFDETITVAGGGVVLNDSTTLGLGTASGEGTFGSNGTTMNLTTTAALTIGDGGTTNYSNFAASTGLLTFLGTARRTKSEFIPASAFLTHSGSGAEGTQVGAGIFRGWALDSASDEAVQAQWVIPDNVVAGTTGNAYVYWASGTGGNAVVWDVQTVVIAEGADLAGAGTTNSVTDTGDANANYLNVTAAMATDALTAGSVLAVRVNRDANNAADTLGADAVLLGVRIDYTADRI